MKLLSPTMRLLAASMAGLLLPLLAHAQSMVALRIRCDGDHVGARVSINEQFRGECPLDVAVAPGPVQLRVSKDVGGLKERVFEQSFTMVEGSAKSVEVMLGGPQLTAEGRAAEAAAAEAKTKAAAAAAARRARIGDAQARFDMFDRPRLEDERKLRLEETYTAMYAAMGARPGQVLKECPECPEMVVVAPGRIVQSNAYPDEGMDKVKATYLTAVIREAKLPSVNGSFGRTVFNALRDVEVSAPFAIGRYELSYEEYDRCVAAGACGPLPEGVTPGTFFDSSWGRGRQPVLMGWSQVGHYIAWLKSKTGKTYRLPTVAEWVLAASAGKDMTLYPWGDRNTQGRARMNGESKSLPVGSFAANALGLYDVIGNVAEWAGLCYDSAPESVVVYPGPSFQSAVPLRCSFVPMGGSYAEAASHTGPAAGLAPVGVLANPQYFGYGVRLVRETTQAAPTEAAALPQRDCPDCPEVIAIAGGDYVRGSPPVAGKDNSSSPQAQVRVPAFALARDLVTVAQYAQFITESGHVPLKTECWQWNAKDLKWVNDGGLSWLRPGFAQDKDSAVVCVSRSDALAYIDWLNKKTGQNFRLPSEVEWEFAAGEPPDTRKLGQQLAAACKNGLSGCNHAARQNTRGLRDLWGVLRQFVADCAEKDYLDAPTDGSPRKNCDSKLAVVRGSDAGERGPLPYDTDRRRWFDEPYNQAGFRLARDAKP